MIADVNMPKLGVEMTSARLDEWLVAEGAEIAAGTPIASVETEKVISDVESPGGGLIHLVGEIGREYAVGERLALLAETVEEYRQLVDGGAPTAAAPAAPASAPAPAVPAAAPPAQAAGGKLLASPLARRIAAANGVDIATVAGSGQRGAIRRRDVEAALAARPAPAAQAPAPSAPSAAAPDDPAARYDDVPLTPMRRTIADRMLLSMQGTAQMTDVREQDVSALVQLRRDAVAKADTLGFRLSFTALFTKAAAMALEAVPELNASIEGDRLRSYRSIDIGTVVSVPDGLIVPVLRDVQDLGLRQVNERLEELIGRARDRKLTGDEMSGGSFTITNFGTFGSHFGTPILTPGQAAMLGIGAMIERPVVRDGEIVVGTVMFTSVTVDHRVVDGEVAGRFQNELHGLFTDPERLLYG